MMERVSKSDADVAAHYTRTGLVDAIRNGADALGKTPETLTVDDLAAVDEFHVGGRQASEAFLNQLTLTPGQEVLDIGCGLGGSARFAATRYGCSVTGIDITPALVDTGTVLCDWVGLSDLVSLRQGSALDLPFQSAAFDAAYMLHVGMNIGDKRQLCAEAHRVLRPGASFGIYDLMRTGEDGLRYPLPWASAPDTNAVAALDDYRDALQAAGFTLIAERDRRDAALEFFASLRARAPSGARPAPLGLHILMGDTAPLKIANMVAGIANRTLAPMEMMARKTI